MLAIGSAAGYKLFFNERDSDVSIRVEWEGRNHHFPAHALVLSAMSDVFRVMLQTDMKEKRSRQITIGDSSPLTVKQFLKYLYMGILDCNGWVEVVNILKIAHKYSVLPLIGQCEVSLATSVVFSNACLLHDLSIIYSLDILKKDTKIVILDAGFIVTATEGFFNLQPKSLEYFLHSMYFNVENEACVLTSLREWAVCDCSRRCLQLTRKNVLASMEPFLKYIRWDNIPASSRTFVPKRMIDLHKNSLLVRRRSFAVAPILQFHIHILKFVVELGAFYENKTFGVECLKFSVDNHAFLAGFRIVGMFRLKSNISFGSQSLSLKRSDNKQVINFNLNSLPWTKGATTGEYIWREVFAYFPQPVRVDPFNTYNLSIKCSNRCVYQSVKWPSTRLEVGLMHSELGPINFSAYGNSYGLTQLFLLPAPPYRTVCNDD